MHGGTVTAHSDGPGHGCEFVVRLALLYATVAQAPPAVSAGESHVGYRVAVGRRILVVDDNRDAADGFAVLLRLAGHDVQTARDGPEAIRVAGLHPLDAVFLGIGLPGQNGYDVARQMPACRGLRKWRSWP